MRNSISGEKINLAVRLTPNELWRRVTATSDARRVAIFTASGFEGNKRFLYTVSGSEIKMNLRQRRKSIPAILMMKILPTNEGCQNTRQNRGGEIFVDIFMGNADCFRRCRHNTVFFNNR